MYTRVIIADDQLRARRSLKALLTAMRWCAPNHTEQPAPVGFISVEVVGEAEDGPQAVELARMLHPDVVVMDLQMSRLHGVATINNIKSQWPEIRIVVLTMYATNRLSALSAGADVFLLKGCPAREILDALQPGETMGSG